MDKDKFCQVVIINGKPRVGKNTFVEYCSQLIEQIHPVKATEFSSVGNVYDAARLLGWDGEKDARGRQFLSDLKDISTKAYDGPMNYMQDAVGISFLKYGKCVVFLYIREPEEIERAKQVFDAHTVFVESDRPLESFTNHADANVDQYNYDYRVYVGDTLEQSYAAACNFVHHLFLDVIEKKFGFGYGK